jgi:hypothetical protein
MAAAFMDGGPQVRFEAARLEADVNADATADVAQRRPGVTALTPGPFAVMVP